ncbi:9773_t:CDS:2, partial [Racocetra fulgida]
PSMMYPSYIKQHGFDSEQTRFSGKYGLYLYRDTKYDLDFNEEFSALHGHSLLEQAEYLNDAIRYILSLYPAARKNQQADSSTQPLPDPTAVIIIGHSMGGVVARTLFTMPNYQPGSINTILTMATPHILPPAPFDWQISKIYTDINDFWRNGYSQSVTRQNSLADLVKVVAKSLLGIVDIRRAGQTEPSQKRMTVFRKIFLTGLEDPVDFDDSYQFLDMGQRLVINGSVSAAKAYLMPIPPPAPHSTLNTFSFLTDQSLLKGSGLDILLCDVMTKEIPEHNNKIDLSVNDLTLPTAPRLSCYSVSNEASLVPASRSDIKSIIHDKSFNFLKLKVKELGDYQYIAVVFSKELVNGFLIGEFFDERITLADINTSMKDLLIDGIHIDAFPEHIALLSMLRIPVIDSSLLTYKMSIRRTGCVGKMPIFTQSISTMYESKFIVNVDDSDLNIHGQAPFVTPVPNGCGSISFHYCCNDIEGST